MREYAPADPPARNPITGIACCARAASGHADAPASSVMNSRRLIAALPRTSPKWIRARNYDRRNGLRGHVAQQQLDALNVRIGSKADIQGVEPMSAITPK